jgi:hypothetical protein
MPMISDKECRCTECRESSGQRQDLQCSSCGRWGTVEDFPRGNNLYPCHECMDAMPTGAEKDAIVDQLLAAEVKS